MGLGSAGLVVAGSALAACGGDDDALPPQLVALFSPSFVLASGLEQRIPFGLIDQGVPLSDETGEFMTTILRGDEVIQESLVKGRVVAHDHPGGDGEEAHEHASLQRYFAVRATIDQPGIYDLRLDVDGRRAQLTFQVFDPDEVMVPLPGTKLPQLRFPTFDNDMGMDPICTQFGGPCPLHDATIEEKLALRKPLALLIATPALCATAYCGPVLDVLLELRPQFPGVEFLHADVYENQATARGLTDPDLRQSPTVVDLALPFEPTLFLLQPDRTIVDRIDNVFDNTELRDVLSKL